MEASISGGFLQFRDGFKRFTCKFVWCLKGLRRCDYFGQCCDSDYLL